MNNTDDLIYNALGEGMFQEGIEAFALMTNEQREQYIMKMSVYMHKQHDLKEMRYPTQHYNYINTLLFHLFLSISQNMER